MNLKLIMVISLGAFVLALNGKEKIMKTESIVLGGGCFWCVEALYQKVPGVQKIVSGYAGGETLHPTYKEICTGKTGHAEVIEITFDPDRADLNRIIDLFWQAHDPTTLNRQGADVGTQYRSIILFKNELQKKAAESSLQKAQAQFKNPIVTEIAPLKIFYPAEEYHQNYYQQNKDQPYCRIVIEPKFQKFKPY